MSKRPSELDQEAKRIATFTSTSVELVFAVLLENKTNSTWPLIVNKAMLAKLRTIDGLPIRTSYAFLSETNLEECLAAGLDRYDVVPAAVIGLARGDAAARRLYDRVLVEYPSVDVLCRAVLMGPLPKFLPHSVDRCGKLTEEAVKRLVLADRLELLLAIPTAVTMRAMAAVVRVEQLNRLGHWLKLAGPDDDDDWVEAGLNRARRGSFLAGAVEHGRLDLLEWILERPGDFRLFFLKHLEAALKADQFHLVPWLLEQAAARGQGAGALSLLVEYVPPDRLDLVQCAVGIGYSPSAGELRLAIGRGKLKVADWLAGRVAFSALKPDFHCTSGAAMRWLDERGFAGGVDFELRSVVAMGQLEQAQQLVTQWNPELVEPILWTLALVDLLASNAASSADLLGLVLPRLPSSALSDAGLCQLAARHNRLDALLVLKQYGAPWTGDFWLAAIRGQSMDCLQYAKEQGCPLPCYGFDAFVDAIADRDDLWSFMLENLLQMYFAPTTHNVIASQLLAKPGSAPRFRWYKQNYELAPDNFEWPYPGYKLEDLVGIKLPHTLLAIALENNDHQLEQHCCWQVWRISVSVEAKGDDVARFTVRREGHADLIWTWHFNVEWTAHTSADALVLSIGADEGLILHRPPTTTKPLFRLYRGKLLSNEEGHNTQCVYLLLHHLGRLCFSQRDPVQLLMAHVGTDCLHWD